MQSKEYFEFLVFSHSQLTYVNMMTSIIEKIQNLSSCYLGMHMRKFVQYFGFYTGGDGEGKRNMKNMLSSCYSIL